MRKGKRRTTKEPKKGRLKWWNECDDSAGTETKAFLAGIKKVFPMLNQASRHKDVWWNGSVAPCILNFGNMWIWVDSFTPRPLHPLAKSPKFPLESRPGGPRSQTASCEWRREKSLAPVGNLTEIPRSSNQQPELFSSCNINSKILRCDRHVACTWSVPNFDAKWITWQKKAQNKGQNWNGPSEAYLRWCKLFQPQHKTVLLPVLM
jgi:hypothetical protein